MQDNVLAQQGIVSKLSDDQLVKEVKTPSGSAPTYLVMAEMQKRDSIRNAMGGTAPKGTVRDQMLQGAEMRQPEMPLPQVDPAAIAGMMQARGMAPQGMPGMPQGMPPMPQGMPQGAPQMAGMPQMPQMPEMPQGAPPAAGIAGAAQMAGPQGFANGGAIPHYVDGTPNGLPALLRGTADRFGSYSPQELAANTDLLSSFYNKDNLRPEDLGTYQSNILNQFGGIDAFTKPFAAPIDTAQRQLSGMMNPTSQALIQAGAAMMNAPNGSLLSGIGVGLGAGLSGYQKAQLEQRGLQDRMADLQLKQSQAGLTGRMQSMEIGSRERQGDFSQYNTGRTLAENRAAGILGVNQSNATGARSSADAAAGRATTMAAAQLQEAGATARAKDAQAYAIPAATTDLYQKTYANFMDSARTQITKMFPQMAGGYISPDVQASIDAALQKAHRDADGVAKTVSGNYLNGALLQQGIAPRIPGPDGNMVVNPAYKAYLKSLGYAMPF